MYCHSYEHFLHVLPTHTHDLFRRWASGVGVSTFVECTSDRQRKHVLESLAPFIPRSVHEHAVCHMDAHRYEPIGDMRELLGHYETSLYNVQTNWASYVLFMDSLTLHTTPSPPSPPTSTPPTCTLQAAQQVMDVRRLLSRSSSSVHPAVQYLCDAFPDINAEAHLYVMTSHVSAHPVVDHNRAYILAMVGNSYPKQHTIWYQYEYLLRTIHDRRRVMHKNHIYK